MLWGQEERQAGCACQPGRPGQAYVCRQHWADRECTGLCRAQDAFIAVLGTGFHSSGWGAQWCNSEAWEGWGPMGQALTKRVNSSPSLSLGQMAQGSKKAARKVFFRKSSFGEFSETLCHSGSLFSSAPFPFPLASAFLKLHPQMTCLHTSFPLGSVSFCFEGPGYDILIPMF